MYDLLGFLAGGGYYRARIERREQEENGEILHTVVGEYTIDSCNTFDEGYETAIWKNIGTMIIVENYSNPKEMAEGHKKWCKFCESKPKEAFSIQLGETIKF